MEISDLTINLYDRTEAIKLKKMLKTGFQRWKFNSYFDTTDHWGICHDELLPPYSINISTLCFSSEEERNRFVTAFEAVCDRFIIDFSGNGQNGQFEYNHNQPTTLFEWVEACTGAKPPLLESEHIGLERSHDLWWFVHQVLFAHFDNEWTYEYRNLPFVYTNNILKIGAVEFIVYPYEELWLAFFVLKSGSEKQVNYLFDHILVN